MLNLAPHGDWGQWNTVLNGLPRLGQGTVDCGDGAVALNPDTPMSEGVRDALLQALRALRPWRKGPYRIADVVLDTEWRSDWKWERIRSSLASLSGRLVLDVGCGNGYYCWRMAGEGARQVIGIDPEDDRTDGLPHIDHLRCFLNSQECRLKHPIRFTDKGDHGPVGVLARIDVEQIGACCTADCRGNRIDYRLVLSFTEIRNAFDDFFHGDAPSRLVDEPIFYVV